MARFSSLEHRLQRNPPLQLAYTRFLTDYESLGHMRKLTSIELHHPNAYYIPHHAVFQQNDLEKIRVVFNASQVTSSNKSLNNFLFPGPKLQRDITTILTRWRRFAYAFTADITKMFRQILVHPEDALWQRILWRSAPDLPLEEYILQTVTYGTTSAPFLALRVLEQLAREEAHRFPLGAEILQRHMYADDALAILSSAGMVLGK